MELEYIFHPIRLNKTLTCTPIQIEIETVNFDITSFRGKRSMAKFNVGDISL